VFVVLANTFARGGKYLMGETTGVLLLKVGPVVFVETGGMVAFPVFVCSQQYVIGSPLASVAEAVSINGVDLGIV
jgi:hypothetical protein